MEIVLGFFKVQSESLINHLFYKNINLYFYNNNYVIMEAIGLRESVLEYIKNSADTRFLKLVKAMATTYSAEGGLVRDTLEQYNKEIDDAIIEVEKGEYYSQEEVERITKEW